VKTKYDWLVNGKIDTTAAEACLADWAEPRGEWQSIGRAALEALSEHQDARERDEAIAISRPNKAEVALKKIDAIRNSIVGRQAINWSQHIYPLVAALDEAGFGGEGYDVARPKAEAEIKKIRDIIEKAKQERDAAIAEIEEWRNASGLVPVTKSGAEGDPGDIFPRHLERFMDEIQTSLASAEQIVEWVRGPLRDAVHDGTAKLSGHLQREGQALIDAHFKPTRGAPRDDG
jgi:hypothetical protein